MNELSGLSYYGGKSRRDFRAWLVPLIPYEKNGIYVEPFAGMLGVLLARPKTRSEIINDLDGNISNWWKQVRENPEGLMYLIENTPNCRRTFRETWVKNRKGGFKDDPLMWAWATYVCIKFNACHATGEGGWAINYQGSGTIGRRDYEKYIQPLAKRLKYVQIENKDAFAVIDRMKDFTKAVLYCDPPYYTADTSSYTFTHETFDIDNATEIFLSQKGRVAISGYREEWDHLGWERHEWTTRAYPLNDSDDHRHRDWERTEVLWTNYKTQKQFDLF